MVILKRLAGVCSLTLTVAVMAQAPQQVTAALDEADRLQKSDAPRARQILASIRGELARLGESRLIARAELLECNVAGEPPRARAAADRGLVAATRARDFATQSRLLVCRGEAFVNEGRSVEAERDFLQAAEFARRGGDAAAEGMARTNAGYLRYARGANADALIDLQAAYEIQTRLGLEEPRLATLTVIANIYADPEVAQFDRAIEYYRQVLAAYERLNKPADVADTLFNLGGTWRKKGNVAAALDHLQRAAAIFTDLKKPDDTAFTQREIGSTLTRDGRPGEALPWFEKAMRYSVSVDDRDAIAATHQARGSALAKLGRSAEAIRDLEAARPYYEEMKNTRFLARIDEDLAAAYAQSGRSADAFSALQRHVRWQRELFEAQRDEHAARLRVEFDTERRDEVNRALTRENELRASALAAAKRAARLQNGVIALVVLLAIALAALFWRQLTHARRLRIIALTDELTRVPNRRHIMLVANETFDAARRTSSAMSVLTFDIDKFKRINDTWGHAAGDVVLQRVAHVCRMSLRPGDVVGRTGGEEFLVIVRDTDREEAAHLGERLRAAVESTSFSDVDPALHVTISLGVASSTQFASFPDLARRADELLYEAKESGRNRVVA